MTYEAGVGGRAQARAQAQARAEAQARSAPLEPPLSARLLIRADRPDRRGPLSPTRVWWPSGRVVDELGGVGDVGPR